MSATWIFSDRSPGRYAFNVLAGMPLPGTPLRKAAPGRVSGEQGARLESLEGGGKLFGQWRRQAALASALAAERMA